jgi:hypothetical protein
MKSKTEAKYTGIQKRTFIDKRTGNEVEYEADFDGIFIDGSRLNAKGNGYVANWGQYTLLAKHFAGVPLGGKLNSQQYAKMRKFTGAMSKYYGVETSAMTLGRFQQIIDTEAKAPSSLVNMLHKDKAPTAKGKAKVTKSKSTPKLSAKQITELVDDPEKLVDLLKAAGLA